MYMMRRSRAEGEPSKTPRFLPRLVPGAGCALRAFHPRFSEAPCTTVAHSFCPTSRRYIPYSAARPRWGTGEKISSTLARVRPETMYTALAGSEVSWESVARSSGEGLVGKEGEEATRVPS